MDREKVIKEYEDYVNSYISLTTSHDYEFEMHKAVLALLKEQEHKDRMYHALEDDWKRLKELLKEQEAVEPSFKQGEDGIFVWCCGSCGEYMYHIYDGIDKAKEYAKYCRQCGKKVKWE